MHAAFRAIIRPRLIRPAIAVAGGLGLTFGLSRESVHAEMKRAAQDLKKLLPADLVMDQDLAAFNKYADDDGNISNGSFVNAMHELGVHNENVIGSFFRCFDKAGNGVISFEEFVTSIAAIQPSGDPTDRLKFVFQSCDLNGNGKIEKEELRRMIHALLVTRENLHVYQTNYYGPKDWNERKLKRERQLQNHRRKSYPSTGFVDYKESEQLSIFDEWNRAVLIRKNEESDDYEPNAVFISKTTPYGNQPALQNSTEEQKKRLHELYAEFPKLQGKSLNQCLATLSVSSNGKCNRDTV